MRVHSFQRVKLHNINELLTKQYYIQLLFNIITVSEMFQMGKPSLKHLIRSANSSQTPIYGSPTFWGAEIPLSFHKYLEVFNGRPQIWTLELKQQEVSQFIN
jgi:hypothetical protein